MSQRRRAVAVTAYLVISERKLSDENLEIIKTNGRFLENWQCFRRKMSFFERKFTFSKKIN